jgi:hypothetical protein
MPASGNLESRTATSSPFTATSTQSPAPLYELLRHEAPDQVESVTASPACRSPPRDPAMPCDTGVEFAPGRLCMQSPADPSACDESVDLIDGVDSAMGQALRATACGHNVTFPRPGGSIERTVRGFVFTVRLLDHVLFAGSTGLGSRDWHWWECRSWSSGIRPCGHRYGPDGVELGQLKVQRRSRGSPSAGSPILGRTPSSDRRGPAVHALLQVNGSCRVVAGRVTRLWWTGDPVRGRRHESS